MAATFNTLTDSVARFQREVSQKERLSSLGRLSTVIAHEVRNPLMIIKAALHTLRHPDVGPATLREAAADIDEEVARLNRIVNEVLDFARPIRFELVPVDLNALCRESAAAAQATPGAAVRLDLDPSLGVVRTDAERLRVALVNLIVNARHAVEAQGRQAVVAAASPGACPPPGAANPVRRSRRRSPIRPRPRCRSPPAPPETESRSSSPMPASGSIRPTCRASSIHTSRRSAAVPASASRSPRTSSKVSAALSSWRARRAAAPRCASIFHTRRPTVDATTRFHPARRRRGKDPQDAGARAARRGPRRRRDDQSPRGPAPARRAAHRRVHRRQRDARTGRPRSHPRVCRRRRPRASARRS